MNKYKVFTRYRSIAVLITISCAILLTVSVLSSSSSQKKSKPPNTKKLDIKSLAPSVNIIKFNIYINAIFLTIRNESTKQITGFNMQVGSARIQTELIRDPGEFIPPGATYEKTYATQSDLETYGITLAAVVFDDGTSEGDIQLIQEITDYRIGIKQEAQRILPKLERLLDSPNTEIVKELKALESEIENTLSASQQHRKLDNILLGAYNERQRALNEIKSLSNQNQRQPAQLKEALINLNAHYKKTTDFTVE